MTAAAYTRKLVRLDRSECFGIGRVNDAFLEVPGAFMTMKAFSIVVWPIELDFGRLRNCPEVLHVHVIQPTPLCAEIPIHGVVGVAGETSGFGRHSMILEMSGRQERRIVSVEASSVVGHNVA